MTGEDREKTAGVKGEECRGRRRERDREREREVPALTRARQAASPPRNTAPFLLITLEVGISKEPVREPGTVTTSEKQGFPAPDGASVVT